LDETGRIVLPEKPKHNEILPPHFTPDDCRLARC
jgi:hypothetical protein